jgi:hypothetical protein
LTRHQQQRDTNCYSDSLPHTSPLSERLRLHLSHVQNRTTSNNLSSKNHPLA